MVSAEHLSDPRWREVLEQAFKAEAFVQLATRLSNRRDGTAVVYPPVDKIFAAFNTTPFERVKVVILGQDPYHGRGQAMGLSFSVEQGVAIPPSLRNILSEVCREQKASIVDGGDLTVWAEQGVLLLNTVLTVEDGKPGAHAGWGWEQITDTAISAISHSLDGIVFLLWGAFAHKKAALIDHSRHYVLRTTHPSPLSAYRGFNGCGHFGAVNSYLEEAGHAPINW